MSEIKELPIEIRKPIPLPPDVFLYVNPLTGKHATTVQDKKLAVFVNETTGRKWEEISKALKSMVGYYCKWEEMLTIAKGQTGGQYEFFRDSY
jgi:hypothetical protein